MMPKIKKWVVSCSYAVGMAYVEAAAVFYLRKAQGIQDFSPNMVIQNQYFGMVEVGREAATLLMLFTVSWIAGNSSRQRTGFFIYMFGIWDIFYYLWLRLIAHWPVSLLDMDILFFIPLPWWGPVLAPVLVSLLLIAFGIYLIRQDDQKQFSEFEQREIALLAVGVLIMLFSFMQDAITALLSGKAIIDPSRQVTFNWIIFLTGFLLSVLVFIRVVRKQRLNQ
jgi:hypothetical protein